MDLVNVLQFVPDRKSKSTIFDTVNPPSICVVDYVQRISHYLLDDNETLLKQVYFYMNLYNVKKSLTLSRYNVYKIFLSATTVVYKFWDDDAMDNANIAEIGGVSLRVMNTIEVEFLNGVGWDIFVNMGVQDDDVFKDTLVSLYASR